jgi:hypothetical protein
MSEEENGNAATAAKAPVTTKENALAESGPGEWRMPEPVYRQTSGYLPQGFEKQFPASTPQPAAQVAAPPGVVLGEAPAADVEPQPDIIEVLASEPPIAPVVASRRRSTLSIVLIVVGLLARAAVVVGFLIAVYFLFIAAPAETSF